MINVPVCFKKIKSLRRLSFELPILKFINYLMKNGKKEQFFKYFFKILNLFYFNLNIKKNKMSSLDLFYKNEKFKWINNFIILNNVLNFYNFELNLDINLKQKNQNLNKIVWNENEKIIYNEHFIKNHLYLKFLNILPVFNFFVYNVDKNIRKYSRGKSGKYIFIWKYITSYKRKYVAMRLIMKDIKFIKGLKFKNKIWKSLFNLFFKIKKSFLWKSKIFSYNYVFKNYKKTLMRNLKTIR